MIISNDNPPLLSVQSPNRCHSAICLRGDTWSHSHRFKIFQNVRNIRDQSEKYLRNFQEIDEKYTRNISEISEKYLRPGSRSNGAAATPHFLLFQAQAYQSPDFYFFFILLKPPFFMSPHFWSPGPSPASQTPAVDRCLHFYNKNLEI